MNYGFLTECDVFYSHKIFCHGKQIGSGDGTLTCPAGTVTGEKIVAAVKANVMIATVKDRPYLVGKDLSVEITSLNRI